MRMELVLRWSPSVMKACDREPYTEAVHVCVFMARERDEIKPCTRLA